MATYTSKLNLFKYDTVNDASEVFNINAALNNNWDKLDDLCTPTYQTMTTISNGTVNLLQDKVIYYYQIPSATTFTFSTGNLTLSNSVAYTFELLLNNENI